MLEWRRAAKLNEFSRYNYNFDNSIFYLLDAEITFFSWPKTLETFPLQF